KASPVQVGGGTAVGLGRSQRHRLWRAKCREPRQDTVLSCPEGQNFVSRARTTPLRSVLLPRLGGNTSSAIPPSPWAGSRVPPTSLPPNCFDQPVDNRTEPRTASLHSLSCSRRHRPISGLVDAPRLRLVESTPRPALRIEPDCCGCLGAGGTGNRSNGLRRPSQVVLTAKEVLHRAGSRAVNRSNGRTTLLHVRRLVLLLLVLQAI